MSRLHPTHPSLLGPLVVGSLLLWGCGGTPSPPREKPGIAKDAPSRPKRRRDRPTKKEAKPRKAPGTPENPGMELPPPLGPLRSRKLSNGLLVALSKGAGDRRDRVLVFFPRKGRRPPAGMAGIRELGDRLLHWRLKQALEPELLGKAEAALSARSLPGGMLFEVAGRRGELGRALKILTENLMDPQVDPSELPRFRSGLLMELGKNPRRRLLLAFVSQVLDLGQAFPDSIQHDLPRIQPAALSLFLKLSYRPDGAVLLLQGEGWSEEDFRNIGNDLLAWKAGGKEQDAPKARIPFFSFASSPRFTKEGELLVLLPSPSIEDTGTPLSEICWQLFCMDGWGGRLGEELEAHGLQEVRVEAQPLGDLLGTRLLSLSAPGARPGELIAAVRAAIASLEESSPSRSAFEQAKRRVLLSWDRKMNPPSLRAQTLAHALAQGLGPALDLSVLRSLQASRPDDIPEAAGTWLKPAFLFVSSRSQAPRGAIPLGKRVFRENRESSLGTAILQRLPGNPKDWERTREKTLALARSALGLDRASKEGDGGVLGYQIRGKLLASLPFEERWTWDFGRKVVQERLRILKTTIHRRFEPGGFSESLGSGPRALGELEAESYLQGGLLNPLVLLHPGNPFVQSIKAKGKIRLEEGKDLVLLRFELKMGKLRSSAALGIDPDTGLPRRLLYEAPTPSGSRVRTIYLLQEYRMEEGHRFPHTLFRFDRGAYRGELSIRRSP